jgi:hypothetical protein
LSKDIFIDTGVEEYTQGITEGSWQRGGFCDDYRAVLVHNETQGGKNASLLVFGKGRLVWFWAPLANLHWYCIVYRV